MNLDDLHLCIKCNSTIEGLDNYVDHRKHDCSLIKTTKTNVAALTCTTRTEHESMGTSMSINLDNTYNNFTFTAPEPTLAEKPKKSALNESYELPYDLGADVFFSSLQLQSVQTNGHLGSKIGSSQQIQIQRNKSQTGHTDSWFASNAATINEPNEETLLKAMHDISSSKKPFEPLFKNLSFHHDSADYDGSNDIVNEVDNRAAEAVEELNQMEDCVIGNGKWKLSSLHDSSPVVSTIHTDKWKPGNRSNLQVNEPQLIHILPIWECNADENSELMYNEQSPIPDHQQHPPANHTKGKWLPGTELEIHTKFQKQSFWCNICSRKLKSKAIFEQHKKTKYHLKRLEPEQELQKANVAMLPLVKCQRITLPLLCRTKQLNRTKLKALSRFSKYFKCRICGIFVARYLIGKHLISHNHYRRAQSNPGQAQMMVLEHIHKIVLQAAFQCLPCKFYCNTEEIFLNHWNSTAHLMTIEGKGIFWCKYCQFECENNIQMHCHLLSSVHKAKVMTINHAVPIYISKRLVISCPKCHKTFRYNFELRRHIERFHGNFPDVGSTASDVYQCRFKCYICNNCFETKTSLLRHEKNIHSISKYFCTICKREFSSPCQARRHRKSVEHRMMSISIIKEKKGFENKINNNKEDEQNNQHRESSEPSKYILDTNGKKCTEAKLIIKRSSVNTVNVESLKSSEITENRKDPSYENAYMCICCGRNFRTPQALGRHTRLCHLLFLKSPSLSKRISTELPWACERCYMSFNLKSDLHFHSLHHKHGNLLKNQYIRCPFCSKLFLKHSLRCHLRLHTNEKIYKCEICGSMFARKHNLKQHSKNKHSTGQAKGNHKSGHLDNTSNIFNHESVPCNQQLESKSNDQGGNLLTHSLAHHEILHCSFQNCKYNTSCKGSFKLHLLTHSKEEFPCQINDCKYIGRSLYHLKRHKKSHVDIEKPINCDQCNFQTKQKIHLHRHQERKHFKNNMHQCPHCHFSCNSIDNLRKHVLKTNKHLGKFMFECQLCGDGVRDSLDPFKTNSYREYKLHLNEKHMRINSEI